ncbi:MAG: sensor histidine kinase [Sulfurihydrogenibium sp.]
MKYSIDISKQDWFIVFVFAVIFGGVLGSFITILLNLGAILNGFIAGLTFGFSIFLHSLLLITFSNHFVLKHIPEKYWEFVSLFFSFMAGFLGSLVAYTFLKSINILKIDFSQKVLITSFVMIGTLTSLLGYLLYWVVNIRKMKMEVEKSLILAKLKSLEYQINPHFMFNTLNVLAELTHINPSLAEKSILTFSKYLRDMIDEESVIPLRKELSIVENFLFIQRLRFPDIEVEYDLDDSLMDLQVPKLSIQILVENAIKHGIGSKGKIKIKSYRQDGKVVIEVIDNGKGFENLTEGTGLKNLRNRLKYLVDGDLFYERRNGETVFRIEIKR